MNLKTALDYILNNWLSAIQRPLAGNEFAAFFQNEFQQIIKSQVDEFNEHWVVNSSVGKGVWANIPWLSILNPNITDSTQNGIYPVFIFCADASGFYLSLMQGVSEPAKKLGKKVAEKRAAEIKKSILKALPELKSWITEPLDLKATTNRGRSYQTPNIAAKYYPADAVPDSDVLKNDL